MQILTSLHIKQIRSILKLVKAIEHMRQFMTATVIFSFTVAVIVLSKI